MFVFVDNVIYQNIKVENDAFAFSFIMLKCKVTYKFMLFKKTKQKIKL